MEITEVRVFPTRENRLLAYVSITLDDCFVIRDLKIIQGDSGLFVAMPARRREDGTYRDVAHPLNSQTRAMMEERVLAAYHELAKSRPSPADPEEDRESDASESEDDEKRAAPSGGRRNRA